MNFFALIFILASNVSAFAYEIGPGCSSTIASASLRHAEKFENSECTPIADARLVLVSAGEGTAEIGYQCANSFVVVHSEWMNDGDGGCRVSHFAVRNN